MSFGTGHHATTYLMVDQMSALDFKDKQVLDFGTGTGILAILAEKMGAAAITAIDNDAWSIENAKENIEMNKGNKINVLFADAIPLQETYDIILANINRNVIMDNLGKLNQVSRKGTIVLLSGFLESDKPAMLEEIIKNGFILTDSAKKGDWICTRLIKD